MVRTALAAAALAGAFFAVPAHATCVDADVADACVVAYYEHPHVCVTVYGHVLGDRVGTFPCR